MNDRKDRIPYVILVIITWSYVVVRAWMVPMVHDECASVLWYVQPGEWMPNEAHLDTNNHLTSSAIGVFSVKLFGVHPFTVRIGSVLSFLVYAWGCWHIGRRVKDIVVRWCLWPALLLIPFVLDFFSMFRGYALEMAAWMLALEMLLRFATSGAARHLIAALVCLALATVSMVVLLPAFVVGIGLLGLLQLRSWRTLAKRERIGRAVYMITFGAVPLLWLVKWILRFKEHGLLVYGGDDSFMQVTVRSLMLLVTGSDAIGLSWLVVILLAGCVIMVVRQWSKTRDLSSPLILLTGFLGAEVLLRVMMAVFTGANYPPDRTGMHYVPWGLCCFAFAADGLVARVHWIRWAVLPLLALPMRTIATANTDHVLIWPEQSVPARFVERVLRLEAEAERPLVIGSHVQMRLCWLYAARQDDRSVPFLQPEEFPEGLNDLRVVDRRVRTRAMDGYTAIDSADGPGLLLLQRTVPLVFVPKDTVLWQGSEGNAGYFGTTLPDSLLRLSDLLVYVRIPLTYHERSPGLTAVFEVNDRSGAVLFYDAFAPVAQRMDWNGDTLICVQSLRSMPDATRLVFYLFNPEGAHVKLGKGSVNIYQRIP